MRRQRRGKRGGYTPKTKPPIFFCHRELTNPYCNLHLTFTASALHPKSIYLQLDESSGWKELVDERDVKKGWFRELEVDVVLDLNGARSLHKSLTILYWRPGTSGARIQCRQGFGLLKERMTPSPVDIEQSSPCFERLAYICAGQIRIIVLLLRNILITSSTLIRRMSFGTANYDQAAVVDSQRVTQSLPVHTSAQNNRQGRIF